MQMHIYLTFDGQCEEALTFYAACLGGTVGSLFRHRDMPATEQVPPTSATRSCTARCACPAAS